MSAKDHLSGQQFEIVQPHRMVRFGQHAYPAVWTAEHPNGYKSAEIPMENGALYHVDQTPGAESVGHYSIHALHYAVRAPKERKGTPRENAAGLTSVGTAFGPDDLHSSLQALSRHPLDKDAVEANRVRMRVLREMSAEE